VHSETTLVSGGIPAIREGRIDQPISSQVEVLFESVFFLRKDLFSSHRRSDGDMSDGWLTGEILVTQTRKGGIDEPSLSVSAKSKHQ